MEHLPLISKDTPYIVVQNPQETKLVSSADQTFCPYGYFSESLGCYTQLPAIHCRIPELAFGSIRSISYGWVILSDDSYVKRALWNHSTSKLILLPPLDLGGTDFNQCCLTSSPLESNSALLLPRRKHKFYCVLPYQRWEMVRG